MNSCCDTVFFMLEEVRRSSNRGSLFTPFMRNPSISDYVCALGNPVGVFRTLGDVEAERDVYGEIELRAGNSAAVFTYLRDGARRFMKCYVRPNPYLRPIYRYIEQNQPPLLPDVSLLPEELYVHTLSGPEGWRDVVEGAWVEGDTLDVAIVRASRNGDRNAGGDADAHSGYFIALAGRFDELCRELLAQEWAHGDLKPENIVVCPDGTMSLIDCDAMWIPELEGLRAIELGTPAYRHPRRDASHFGKRMDDYPMLLISASLHALAADPSLFARHNTTDNIIFSPQELAEGRSAAFAEVAELFARRGMARELRMLGACCSPFPEVENIDRFFCKIQPGCVDQPLETVVVNGKWGFADTAGSVVVEPFWDEVLDFREGRAAVRLEGWWHMVDAAGNLCETGLSVGGMLKRRK